MQWDDRIRRRLKLHDLDVLLTVIQTGSMGKAATALRMSQPAISKSIAFLEQTLAVKLLNRSQQGIEPTPYGMAIAQRGLAVFDELRQGTQDIEFLSDPTVGEVRIGGSENVGATIFAAVIERIARKYPRITFKVVYDDSRNLFRDIKERRIDVMVGGVSESPGPEFSVEFLFDDPTVVVAAPHHVLARRHKKIEAAELLEHKWTMQPADNPFGALAREGFLALGLSPPTIAVESTSAVTRRKLLATGRFLTILPRCSVILPRKDPAIKILKTTLPRISRPVSIITLQNRLLNPASQRFVAEVQKATKKLASLT